MSHLPHLTLALVVLCCNPANATQCAPPGQVNVLKSDDGTGFIFYPSRAYGDTVFFIPGEKFAKDAKAAPGMTAFFVDGIYYQFLTVPRNGFVSGSEAASDATVLDRHTAHGHRFALGVGGPLTELQVFGKREKPATSSSPKFVFKLWLLKSPKDPAGPRQYYLTTVVGDEVAALSAIIEGPSFEAQAMSAFNSFASSFQYVVAKQDCPSLPTTN